jgi:hypothetical protein
VQGGAGLGGGEGQCGGTNEPLLGKKYMKLTMKIHPPKKIFKINCENPQYFGKTAPLQKFIFMIKMKKTYILMAIDLKNMKNMKMFILFCH